MGTGCTPRRSADQAQATDPPLLPQLDDVPPPPAPDAPPEPEALREILAVQLLPPRVLADHRWEAENTGLLLMLLELGLADLNDVVPQVGAQGAAIGLRQAPLTAVAWTAALALDGPEAARTATLNLCSAPESCRSLSAPYDPLTPGAAAAQLLSGAAGVLNRTPRAGSEAAWADRLSADPYAQLITGRGAATMYGVLPAPTHLGDPRADPVMRAVLIDPTNPTAEWMRARRLESLGDAAGALEAITRARAGRPEAVALRAAEAALQSSLGHPAQALDSYSALERGLGPSARFVLPLCEAAVLAGAPERAAARLDALPAPLLAEAAVAELRVRVADAIPGDDARYDALLVRWAEASPTDAEPLRRRVALRVRRGDLLGALDLVPAYAPRGAQNEGQQLGLALQTALGQLDAAAATADAMGEPALARRLRARAAAHTAEVDLRALATDPDPGAQLVAGWSALDTGDRAAAATIADGLLAAHPYDPDALALRAAVSGAPEHRAAVFWADPAYTGRLR